MKELKILAVLVFFTGVMYWGIEPYAHHVFHPEVKPADYSFSDLHPNAASANEVANERARINQMIASGDADAGRMAVETNCAACHTVKAAGIAMMDDAMLISANGLLPPDLSNAATLYDEVFLMEFIKNPANAAFITSHTLHQKEHLAEAKAAGGDSEKLNNSFLKGVEGFNTKVQSTFTKMPGYEWLGEQEIANILAFLRTTAKPVSEISGKEITINACARCHSVDYDKVPVQGDLENITNYLGATPPDLSTMILSKKAPYLHTFINDPQKHLLGTGMPRVGLTEAAQVKVVDYLDKVGDPKKEERNSLGLWFVLYFIVLAVLAYAWKHNEFKEIGK